MVLITREIVGSERVSAGGLPLLVRVQLVRFLKVVISVVNWVRVSPVAV